MRIRNFLPPKKKIILIYLFLVRVCRLIQNPDSITAYIDLRLYKKKKKQVLLLPLNFPVQTKFTHKCIQLGVREVRCQMTMLFNGMNKILIFRIPLPIYHRAECSNHS